MGIFADFKSWWKETKPLKRINPFMPGMSFGKAREVYDKGKKQIIKTGTNIIRSISLPLFLIAVIGILVLIFWKRIVKLIPLK